MTDARTPRTLMIPDHLWHAYDQMAREMGNDRDGLISQALFNFARMNGYVMPGSTRAGIPPLGNGLSEPTAAGTSPLRRITPQASPPVRRVPPLMEVESGPRLASSRPPANAERVAELERQLSAAPPPRLASSPPPVDVPTGNIQVDDSLLGDDEQQSTSMDLPSLDTLGMSQLRPVSGAAQPRAPRPPEPPETTPSPIGAPRVLVLLADGREIDRVTKERFLIGRGKHCDLIINSGKVSREHAAITREGNDYFIEDLGSSNGTWYDKRRISRRQIEEGDEYFICAERLSCSFK